MCGKSQERTIFLIVWIIRRTGVPIKVADTCRTLICPFECFCQSLRSPLGPVLTALRVTEMFPGSSIKTTVTPSSGPFPTTRSSPVTMRKMFVRNWVCVCILKPVSKRFYLGSWDFHRLKTSRLGFLFSIWILVNISSGATLSLSFAGGEHFYLQGKTVLNVFDRIDITVPSPSTGV